VQRTVKIFKGIRIFFVWITLAIGLPPVFINKLLDFAEREYWEAMGMLELLFKVPTYISLFLIVLGLYCLLTFYVFKLVGLTPASQEK